MNEILRVNNWGKIIQQFERLLNPVRDDGI
jgi:hypothetical protein